MDDEGFQVVKKRRKPKPLHRAPDADFIFKLIQKSPGITIYRIQEALDGAYVSTRTGQYLTVQEVGDIVYEELRTARLVYSVGKHPTAWYAT